MVVREDAEVERYVRSTVERPGHWENISHVVSTYSGPDNWKQNFVWSDEVDGTTTLEQADVLDYGTDTNTSETTRSFYHRNALGSVTEITDMNEVAVASYRYDPYGAMTTTVGGTPQAVDPLGQHWTYKGRFFDEESGLICHRDRYYVGGDAHTVTSPRRSPPAGGLLGRWDTRRRPPLKRPATVERAGGVARRTLHIPHGAYATKAGVLAERKPARRTRSRMDSPIPRFHGCGGRDVE